MDAYAYVGLVLIGCLSPLLTLTHLWQMKEWRMDRLKEHLEREGVWKLWGILRPIVLCLCYLVFLVNIVSLEIFLAGTLITFSALSLLQFVTHRQPMPVWTMKARAIILCAIVLDVLLTAAFLPLPDAIPGILILQPGILALAWLLLRPLDFYLKKKIYDQAQSLRTAHSEVTVIGITGSVGKTTTKELLAHVLSDKGAVATPIYMNSEIGLAQWMSSVLSKNVPPILIVEMGAYKKGEIKQLCEIAKPHMGIVTFIGSQHMALFGSQQALLDAKGELIDALPKDGRAFLNADSALCASLQKKARCPVTLVGTGGHADLEAFDIEETSTGIRFRVNDTVFALPLHGTHNVTNVLLSIATAEKLGMSRSEIAERLKSFKPLPETFAVRNEHGVTILDDTHNASETSFRAAIEWARSQPLSPKTLVTYGLIELGDLEDRYHTELGALSSPVFDRVLFTSENGREAFQKGYGKPVERFAGTPGKVKKDSLLVCVGKVAKPYIERLLP